MYDPSEALLQLGLYDYVWGNPALLQTYNANVQAAKARKEQQDYNTMWKNIELAKMQHEKDKQEAEKLRAAKVELAKLNRDFTKAEDPRDRVAIKAEMKRIVDQYPSLTIDRRMVKEAEKAATSEDSRQRNVMQGKAKIYADAEQKKSIEEKNKFLNDLFGPVTKENEAEHNKTSYNYNLFDFNEKDKNEVYEKVLGVKTYGEKVKDQDEGIGLDRRKKKIEENQAEWDALLKLAESAKRKREAGHPERVTNEELDAEKKVANGR